MSAVDQKSLAFFRDRFVPFSDVNLSIASSPVLYGLAIYTVFGVFRNERHRQLYVFRMDEHYDRLVNSAKIMDFSDFAKKWPREKFKKTMLALIERNQIKRDALVRVTVFVDEILAGTKMHGLKNSLAAFIYPLTELLPMTGCRLMVSSWQRTPDKAIPPRAKVTGNYVNSSLIKNEAVVNGFDDGIALDAQGRVTESSVANIFLVKDGEIVTPNAEADILDGITCDSLLSIADQLGIAYTRRPIEKGELYEADEAFLCGSSALVTPIAEIDKKRIGNGKPGPLTKRLMEKYDQIIHADSKDFARWRLAV